MTAYEPQVMRHPNARKGKITPIVGTDPVSGKPFRDSQGEPDVFPEVTVKDATNEAYYRARGYLFAGEVPAPPAAYAEYPVMLTHPNHKDAVPDDYVVEKGEHDQIIRHKIPGSPEEYPPRQAATEAEETALNAKGYLRAGHDDPEAVRRSTASPYDPNHKTEEFPKMGESGEIEDPDAPSSGPAQYPKWVKDRVVNNRAEEDALLGKPKAPVTIAPKPKAPAIPVDRKKVIGSPSPVLNDGRMPLKETARQRRHRQEAEKTNPAKLRGSAQAGE